MTNQPVAAVLPSAFISQIQAVLQKDNEADCIALVCREALTEREYRHVIAGIEVRCVYCVSELAMREVLVSHLQQTSGKQRLVLLTPLDIAHLAQDVLARLWRNEPLRLSPLRTLQQVLMVREIDPRLTRKANRWMADALLSGYERIRADIRFGEVLDLESAWRAIAMAHLQYKNSSVDLRSLLSWSSREDVAALMEKAPADLREHLTEWFHLPDPQLRALVGNILLGRHAADFIALALVCSVLYCPLQEKRGAAGAAQFHMARGMFTERYLASARFNNALLKQLGDEAADLIRSWVGQQPYAAYAAILSKAEQILASLDMAEAARASDFLVAGLHARFSAFAKALEAALAGKGIDEAELAFADINKHALARIDLYSSSVERAGMAIRLARWLVADPIRTGSAADLMADYIVSGGFCDWARSEIWSGDAHDDVNAAYQKLSAAIRDRREQQNQAFGGVLASVARGDQLPAGMTPVEQALDTLVAPLGSAKEAKVLLLVLDGMSQAVYRQLGEEFSRHNWTEIQPLSNNGPFCLVAALPTCTQFSRCSLLSGSLCEGNASDEKRAFAAHPTLKRLASTRFPPVLFHKQDLSQSGSGSLNGDVRSVIAGTEHRFVGVVINAIDDQLSSSSQVAVDWSFDSIALLRQVMEAAREAGRIVIVTSDHGHVLEHDSVYQQSAADNGERYQPASEAEVSPLEVNVTGPRVISADKKVVLPWSERVRYTRSKNHGYHGGGTLQEVVIPLGVYMSVSTKAPYPDGWKPVARKMPNWWMAPELSLVVQEPSVYEAELIEKTTKSAAKTKRAAMAEVVDDLFAEQPAKQTPAPQGAEWGDALLESPLYLQMRERVRAPITDDEMRALVQLLQRYQWQVMEAQLSAELSIPKMRLRGFLSNAQRLLNVDGYAILSVERESQTVRLNVSDLRKQFELG